MHFIPPNCTPQTVSVSPGCGYTNITPVLSLARLQVVKMLYFGRHIMYHSTVWCYEDAVIVVLVFNSYKCSPIIQILAHLWFACKRRIRCVYRLYQYSPLIVALMH